MVFILSSLLRSSVASAKEIGFCSRQRPRMTLNRVSPHRWVSRKRLCLPVVSLANIFRNVVSCALILSNVIFDEGPLSDAWPITLQPSPSPSPSLLPAPSSFGAELLSAPSSLLLPPSSSDKELREEPYEEEPYEEEEAAEFCGDSGLPSKWM